MKPAGPPELFFRPVTALAASLAAREFSAVELMEAVIARTQAVDGRVRAFNSFAADDALAQARASDARRAAGQARGPLEGIPVGLKDVIAVKDQPLTASSRMLANFVSPYDSTATRKLKAAGAICWGRLNLDEFAMGSSTENSAFQATCNPWDLERVPGGSSGGSAAAVAAGEATVALGSDTGGSIRQPAALCGVVGMKPTYGRVSRFGLVAFASSLDQIGPFASTVEDAALLFDVLAGHDPLDSTSLASTPEPALAQVHDGAEGVRVALCRDLVEGCAPDVVARVEEAAEVLTRAGAKVEEISIPEFGYGLSAYYLIAPAEASSNLARYDGVRYGLRVDGDDVAAMNTATRTAGFGAEVKRRIMLGTYALSAGYYDAYYAQAQRVRTLVMQAFDRAYETFDVLLGATAPTTAFDLGAKVDDPMAMYMNDVCTIPSNLSGHPALSVPFGTGDDGLPVGVQVLAPALGEALMFRVARVVEAGAPEAAS
jgi:aspartyl-tRNA(Asn)/glutamyl-tRNA(Gln) amidotransferase subunit A